MLLLDLPKSKLLVDPNVAVGTSELLAQERS